MDPRNLFRVKEALLSVLAGDIFSKTPIWPALLAFKVIHYISVLRHLPRSRMAWRKRRTNISPVDDEILTNP